jgi:hypothetical protein
MMRGKLSDEMKSALTENINARVGESVSGRTGAELALCLGEVGGAALEEPAMTLILYDEPASVVFCWGSQCV